jgi:chemotaxis protein CheD
MATLTAQKNAERASVAIGEAVVATEPTVLTTILGSCVALTLYVPQLKLGVLGHIVLPRATEPTSYPAKFADTAVPLMLAMLKDRGARVSGAVAKIAGGACMFGDGKLMQIGENNIQATQQALAAAGVRVVGQDVGGTVGRRVSFDLASGSLAIQPVGHPSYTI